MKKSKIAYFGHPGSFTHIAAQKYAAENNLSIELELPCGSIAEVVEFTRSGEFTGVVPYMNSIAGQVDDYIKPHKENDFKILAEQILPISHCLIVDKKINSLSSIKEVISHKQALKQCSQFLERSGIVNLVEYSNTSTAAKSLAQGKIPLTSAIIASNKAAEIYGLKVLKTDIQNTNDNKTVFHIISM